MTSTATPRRADGSTPRLLVVDDEEVLAELLVESLTFGGYQVDVARTGSQALSMVSQVNPDLILLDVNLPDFNGFAVAARLRAAGDDTPIMFLTARDAPADLRDGFGSGADDYLTKPFRLEELRLRVEALLRRTIGHHPPVADTRIEVADLVIDTVQRTARRADQLLDLSATEFRLLDHLARNLNKVQSTADLIRHVWDSSPAMNESIVDEYVTELRGKVDRAGPSLLHTIAGSGYILRASRT